MIGLPCITTWTGRGGCRVLGEHLSTCRGIAYDARNVRAVECKGCLPQPATRGLLCESCFERHEAALDVAVDLITHLRSIERAAVPDGPPVHSKPGPRMILPTSWLTADATWAELRELAFRVDSLEFLDMVRGGTNAYQLGVLATIEQVRDAVELAVGVVRADGDRLLGDAHTARLAVAFYRQVQRALSMFPFEERAHAVAYARCRECGQQTLERRPPLEYLDPITVRCVNRDCGAVFDPAMVEFDLAKYRADLAHHPEGAIA